MKKIILFIGVVSLFVGCGVKDIKNTPHSVTEMIGNIPVAGWKEFNYPKAKNKQQNKTIDYQFEFALNSYKLDKKYYKKLKQLMNYLQKNPTKNIKIEGFTDNIGTYEYNKKLSYKRAEAIKNILVDKFKISPKRIKIVAYGIEAKDVSSPKRRKAVIVFDDNLTKNLKSK